MAPISAKKEQMIFYPPKSLKHEFMQYVAMLKAKSVDDEDNPSASKLLTRIMREFMDSHRGELSPAQTAQIKTRAGEWIRIIYPCVLSAAIRGGLML